MYWVLWYNLKNIILFCATWQQSHLVFSCHMKSFNFCSNKLPSLPMNLTIKCMEHLKNKDKNDLNLSIMFQLSICNVYLFYCIRCQRFVLGDMQTSWLNESYLHYVKNFVTCHLVHYWVTYVVICFCYMLWHNKKESWLNITSVM